MTYERPTQYKSSASERAHGFFTTKYGDAFEDDMTRGKLRNFRAPCRPGQSCVRRTLRILP